MGKFEIYIDKANEYRFRLKASNGQIILASEGYSSKSSCINGIKSVQNNSVDQTKYDKKDVSTGYKFNLLAGNGQIIGVSEIYTTTSARDNGILSVTKNAPEAVIVEL